MAEGVPRARECLCPPAARLQTMVRRVPTLSNLAIFANRHASRPARCSLYHPAHTARRSRWFDSVDRPRRRLPCKTEQCVVIGPHVSGSFCSAAIRGPTCRGWRPCWQLCHRRPEASRQHAPPPCSRGPPAPQALCARAGAAGARLTTPQLAPDATATTARPVLGGGASADSTFDGCRIPRSRPPPLPPFLSPGRAVELGSIPVLRVSRATVSSTGFISSTAPVLFY